MDDGDCWSGKYQASLTKSLLFNTQGTAHIPPSASRKEKPLLKISLKDNFAFNFNTNQQRSACLCQKFEHDPLSVMQRSEISLRSLLNPWTPPPRGTPEDVCHCHRPTPRTDNGSDKDNDEPQRAVVLLMVEM
ncbi:hypothetical protein BaRGS_00026176 [Batillaria attramentaria]|uniref:Uncharacterized protein n=1 Tax=Batillaria attramentaria TaxID=370345 RepID=A0ABD0K6K5_9CAEN